MMNAYSIPLTQFGLSSPFETIWYRTTSNVTSLSTWIFNAYSIDFANNTTTIIRTLNTVSYLDMSLNGYAYYDIPQVLVFGTK